jgi:hemoglobin
MPDHPKPPVDLDAIYTPPAPPTGPAPSPQIFLALGEKGIFRMCEDFYAQLEKTPLRPMFPEDMRKASEKLACFLVGVCGGPPLYHQRFGPPRMRARHFPFSIDEEGRNHWLSAFRRVLVNAPEQYGFPVEHLPAFDGFLERFSAWMVNREPGTVEYTPQGVRSKGGNGSP